MGLWVPESTLRSIGYPAQSAPSLRGQTLISAHVLAGWTLLLAMHDALSANSHAGSHRSLDVPLGALALYCACALPMWQEVRPIQVRALL